MKKLAIAIFGLATLSLIAIDADARRFGGGRNLGMQRSAPPPQKAAPATSAQQQPQAAPATPAQQPQPTGAQKWLGPLAGFALGAGLVALFINNGVAGLLAGLLLLALVIAAVAYAARVMTRGRTEESPLRYAGATGPEPAYAALPGGAGANSVAATTTTPAAGALPAGFDAAEFTRHARVNFMKLQEAHDRKDLSGMRDFLAPDVYREIEADILAAGDAQQKTEVLVLEAAVLEVAEEAGNYIVSVQFSGLVREDAASSPQPLNEIWHLQKPVSGRAGWVVAGIQQS